ncbi:MAG: HipA domain-containing protein [Salinisphaera sp.]|nr:HipA domain-containing protein [Salinisphaera sp.]
MARAERRRARQVKETPRTLREADYLLRVNDYARQGALRFCLPQRVGVFQAPSTDKPIPPLVNLASLLSAAAHVETDTDTIEDLRLLLQPGSSLGGARPKASVLDANGKLAVAKFPSDGDDYNLVRWEGVALALAAMAGIQVPDWRIEPVAGKDVLLLTRFDRQGSARVPYQSAMTMLGASDNEDHSYLEIADCLNRFGANPAKDKAALWRRIVFNILITNTDDHLRNHGFLRESGLGWQLSPAFDMNPVPTDIGPRFLRTAVGIDDDEASLVLALEQADYFQLGQSDAKRIAAEVGAATAQWRDVAKRLGIAAIECQRMASAFEHTDLEHALALHRQPGRAS